MAKGNFIKYVVSDNPNKYPNGGEQGGYYYEMVIQGGSNSGQYAWKKFIRESGIKNISAQITGTYVYPSTIRITSNNSSLPVSKLTRDDLVGLKIYPTEDGNGVLSLESDKYYYKYPSNYGRFNGNWSWSSSTGEITLSNVNTTDYAQYWKPNPTGYKDITKDVETIVENFIGYVVSDDSSAYPNNATHTDGYYYTQIS